MKLTIGALAHVDAGKTTLSESILYKTNTLRKKGRVDNKDSFLDFNSIEKEKGITVFNKQANFKYKDKDYIYIDTPGHNDLDYESNRAISILDCAIVLISAIEDIPIDTIKKFNNLLNYNIPIIIFVNKMDISSFSKEDILTNIQNKLSKDAIEYTKTNEFISLMSEDLLDTYLNTNSIDANIVSQYFSNNTFFPVFFGSALKDEGINELLDYINTYVNSDYKQDDQLNTYIYKISNDYSYIKVLSGMLLNKTSFGEYKINEMYEVSGNTYLPITCAMAGDIIAVKGLKQIPIGTYLPSFNKEELFKMPTLTYRILSDLDANELFKKAEPIINEFPELDIKLDKNNIYIELNGELHATIVSKLFKDRLGIDVTFSDPIIRYKETINQTMYGVGHFEPLRHYAEVIVNLKPYDNGIKINTLIDNSYTNTLVSYLRNYTIRGILTNSPLTNIEIDIVDIKTHPKHTEGGDLIQATKRAIRQALSKIDSILLEPFYLVSIDTNVENINEIISYLTQNKCVYSISDNTIITKIALSSVNAIITGLRSKLKGQLSFSIEDTVYDECDNAEDIINKRNYDYRSDMINPAGSVFCKSGAGHYVEPEDVESNMHLNLTDYFKTESTQKTTHNKVKISDDELNRVWNSLYKPRPRYIEKKKDVSETYDNHKKASTKPLLYLIDGYNLMYFLDEENAINNLLSARENIINLVCDYAGYVAADVILVFDAYKTDMVKSEIVKQDNITVVYTKRKQTADNYIEHKSKELSDIYKITVVTSDAMEQLRVYANNASLISSREFLQRYNNLRKNNTKLNNAFKYKPFEDIKDLLEDEETND